MFTGRPSPAGVPFTTSTTTAQPLEQSFLYDSLFSSVSDSRLVFSSSAASSSHFSIGAIVGIAVSGVAIIMGTTVAIVGCLYLKYKRASDHVEGIAGSTEPTNDPQEASRAPYGEAQTTTREAAPDGFAQGRVIFAEEQTQRSHSRGAAGVPAARVHRAPLRPSRNHPEFTGMVIEQHVLHSPVRVRQPLPVYGSGTYFTAAEPCDDGEVEQAAFGEHGNPFGS